MVRLPPETGGFIVGQLQFGAFTVRTVVQVVKVALVAVRVTAVPVVIPVTVFPITVPMLLVTTPSLTKVTV
jgi:hypothetical protein